MIKSNQLLLTDFKREFEYVQWIDAFTTEEVDKILEYVTKLKFEYSPVPSYDPNRPNRKANISQIYLDEETEWLFEKISFIIAKVNEEFFRFDLTAILERLQVAEYTETEGYIDWHMDRISNESHPHMKLNLVLQLSDELEYEGGELEIMGNKRIHSPTKKKGSIHLFPTYMQHRVKQVTSGKRISLTAFAIGPSFR